MKNRDQRKLTTRIYLVKYRQEDDNETIHIEKSGSSVSKKAHNSELELVDSTWPSTIKKMIMKTHDSELELVDGIQSVRFMKNFIRYMTQNIRVIQG